MGWKHEQAVVLVTGASSGIGRATAAAYAGVGSRVLLAARRQEDLEEAAREIAEAGGEALPMTVDVTVAGDVQAMVDRALEVWGRIDVLVNNAGIGLDGEVDSVDLEHVRRVLEVNYIGALRCLQAVAVPMKAAGRGRILQVSSIVGRRSVPTIGAYAATKFALEGISQAARVELARHGIRVTIVRPGLTATPFARSALGERKAPVRVRGMSAEAVARAIVGATRRGPRTVDLTLDGRALLLIDRLAPWLADRLLARMTLPRAGRAPLDE